MSGVHGRRRRMMAVGMGLTMGTGLAMAAADLSFDRYGIIIDRKPFGVEPVAPPPPPPPPLPPEQSVVNQIRMSAVIRDEDGTLRVGLVELKSNRSYMLGVGETSSDGILVVEADYAVERARLRRGPEDYWVSMFGGSNRFERVVEQPAPAVSEPAAPVSTAPAGPAVPGMAAPSPVLAKVLPPVDQKLSYAKRRQQREEARLRQELERMRAAQEEARKAALAAKAKEKTAETETAGATGGKAVKGLIRSGKGKVKGAAESNAVEQALMAVFSSTNKLELSDEEIADLLQEYQKELIRNGQTPLPIPLSPETDRQLVEEGILPPQE